MIELSRYVRLKPEGLVRAEPTTDNGGGLHVYFKRFDVENGREIEPEKSFLSWGEIESRLAECDAQAAALRGLIGLRPRE